MTEWQPIETAPKDGTNILVFCNAVYGEITGILRQSVTTIAHGGPDCDGDPVRAGAKGEWWYEAGGDYYVTWCRPTHWMPLPEPPQE